MTGITQAIADALHKKHRGAGTLVDAINVREMAVEEVEDILHGALNHGIALTHCTAAYKFEMRSMTLALAKLGTIRIKEQAE